MVENLRFLRNRDIIFVSYWQWTSVWFPMQRFARLLLCCNRVFFVNPVLPTSLKPWSWGKLWGVWARKKLIDPEGVELEGVHLITPLKPPLQKLAVFRMSDEQCLSKTLRKAARDFKITRPITFVHPPGSVFVFDLFPQSTNIYLNLDECLDPRESDLMRKADVIFAVSELEYQKKLLCFPSKTYRIHNGIDVELYRQVRGSVKVPRELASLPRPIIGYLGSLTANRLDKSIIESIIINNPSFSFVFVLTKAPLSEDPNDRDLETWLSQFSNVITFRVGSDYPRFVKGFDVGIVPYLNTGFNRSADPLKIYDYLALGKPIVSTPIPASEALSPPVLIGRTPEEFNKALHEAVAKSDDPSLLAESVSIAEKTSVQQALATIDSVLVERNPLGGRRSQETVA